MGKKPYLYYAVARGRAPGVYRSWPECEAQTRGFKDQKYKGFHSLEEAETFVQVNASHAHASLNLYQPAPRLPAVASKPATTEQSRSIENVPPAVLAVSATLRECSATGVEPSVGSFHELGPFYAVKHGQKRGIYRSWAECKAQVHGVAGSVFKKFKSSPEAEAFLLADVTEAMPSQVDDGGLTVTDAVPASSAGRLIDVDLLSELIHEQRSVVHAVLAGYDVFVTGLPGSGKSFLLERLVGILKDRFGDDSDAVAVCASTGAAAVQVAGSTLHALLGCGQGDTSFAWNKVGNDRRSAKRLRNLRVLVVDEISMFSGSFFDAASEALSRVRGDTRPFGGLRLVLCGDFLQLPPVKADTLAFESKEWGKLGLRYFQLWHNHRQGDDAVFQTMLRQVRLGVLPDELRARVGQRFASDATCGGLDAAGLLSTYGFGFKALAAQGYQLPAKGSTALVAGLRVGPPRVPETLGLQDTDPQGVNAIEWPPPSPVLRLVCTNAEANDENRRRLAELQGDMRVFIAVDSATAMDDPAVRRAFKDLLAQPELQLKIGARVMLLKNLRLPSRCKAHPGGEIQTPLVNGSIGVVVGFAGEGVVVEFGHGYRKTVEPSDFSGRVGNATEWSRRQVPLRLAWALTVHKSQGLTLERGDVDLRHSSDPAQVYVALSRFQCLEGVCISSFPPRLSCNSMRKRAMAFHDQLERSISGAGAAGA